MERASSIRGSVKPTWNSNRHHAAHTPYTVTVTVIGLPSRASAKPSSPCGHKGARGSWGNLTHLTQECLSINCGTPSSLSIISDLDRSTERMGQYMCSGYERFRSLASATPRFHKEVPPYSVVVLLYYVITARASVNIIMMTGC
jgi:hypothetical protein